MENKDNKYIENKNISEKSKKDSIGLRIFKIVLLIVLLPAILLYYSIRAIVKKVKKTRWEKQGTRGKLLLLSSTISDIDIMEGYEFENYLKTLFFYAGFSAETTPKSKDFGADLILTDENQNKIVVQAKRYNKVVGIKSVQEILGAIKHYGAIEGYVVSNNYFSYEAETLAREHNIRLIDRDELISMYKNVQKELSISVKESDLAGKNNLEIEKKFPYMI